LSRAVLCLLVFLFDLSAMAFAWVGAFMLRSNFDVPANFMPPLWWGLALL
jgi:hypothetical protein